MKNIDNLISPLDSKRIFLSNRVVMAPLTRSRATAAHIPTAIMAEYYAQRAGAGLIITEGTSPSHNGVGYARIPGIYNQEQIDAWRATATAVHAKGGKIFMQLMHSGRVSHPDNMPAEATIMAPSAIQPTDTKMHVDGKGEQPIPEPKEMTIAEIESTIEEYVQAARNAIEAGFDGVEVHSANGYLLDQFLNTASNTRTDDYGGSVKNRSRFTVSVTQKIVEAIGADRVGIRFSPNGAMNDIGPFDEQKETFEYLAEQMEEIGLLYIHLVNHGSMGAPALPDEIRIKMRELFTGYLILSGGYTAEDANQDLEDNKGDLVAFGRKFIANPDLVTRFKKDAPLNEPNQDTFYTPGAEGYIDYPFLKEEMHNA